MNIQAELDELKAQVARLISGQGLIQSRLAVVEDDDGPFVPVNNMVAGFTIGGTQWIWGDPADYPSATAFKLKDTGGLWALADGQTVDNGQTEGGYVTPDMRGKYPVGYDPTDADYDAVGYGTNTNGFTGYKKHGGDENNHDEHDLKHYHQLGGSTYVQEADTAAISGTGDYVIQSIFGDVPHLIPGDATTMTTDYPVWDGDGSKPDATYSKISHSETDNRPPSFVFIPVVRIA